MNIVAHSRDFCKRWNIDYEPIPKEEFIKFKNRICMFFVNQKSIESLIAFNEEYCFQKGIGRVSYIHEEHKFNLAVTAFYSVLANSNTLLDLLRDIEFGVNLIREQCKDKSLTKDLISKCERIIELSDIGTEIHITKECELKFYPAGAKLLDEGVVNNVLTWLENYPDAYDPFYKALVEYTQEQFNCRVIVDSLRLSLELLLKKLLENKKSLEKQQQYIGSYLKDRGISKDIINMFSILINHYKNYQNNSAKHGDKVKKDEVEFVIYLTGTLMRLLLTINVGEKDNESI